MEDFEVVVEEVEAADREEEVDRAEDIVEQGA